MSTIAQNYMQRRNNPGAYKQTSANGFTETATISGTEFSTDNANASASGTNAYDVDTTTTYSSGTDSVQWPHKLMLYGIPLITFLAVVAIMYTYNPVFTRQKKGPDRLQQQNIWWVALFALLGAITTFILVELCMKH